MINFFRSNQLSTEHLRVIGGDGTPLNTGWKGGWFRLVEEAVKRPLLRVVCLLHMLELPFKALMNEFKCTTNSSGARSGPLGSKISNDDMHLEKVKRTSPILLDQTEWPFPEFQLKYGELSDLRDDQSMLYELVSAHLNGDFDHKVFNRKSSGVHNARWLGWAIRIMQVYSFCDDPSEIPHLNDLVEFIVKVYCPVFFLIKRNPTIAYGSKHFFELVRRSRYLKGKPLEVVNKSLIENSYFAHSELIIVGLLAEPKTKTRAIELIKRARTNELLNRTKLNEELRKKDKNANFEVRHFIKPSTLNWEASTFDELLDLSEDSNLWEPPITRDEPIENLPGFIVLNYPCHTQAVERIVKETSSESLRSCEQYRRNADIVCRLKERSKRDEQG